MKRAMVRVWRELPGVRLLLQVRGELVLEVPERLVADTERLIKATMERAAAMSVPLVAEAGHGAS